MLDWFKFKALADNKINLNQILKFDIGRVENSRKRRKWFPAFSHNVFKRPLSQGWSKLGLCGEGLIIFFTR